MSNIKNGKIRIELKSDLCAGSGYSYAGIVDSDSCYDEHGLPYIPGRRLRGCLRETAEQLLYAKYDAGKIEELFGKTGEDFGSSLKIGNAHIEKASEISRDICFAQKQNRPEFSTQEILGRFSHIVGQTRMEEGVAEKGSLRYTRVVNQKSPIGGENLVFEADVCFEEEHEEILRDTICATRHLGLKRNRGLGNVKMTLEKAETENGGNKAVDLFRVEDLGKGLCRINFAVENMQPLMISASSEDESENYIPGQQVLGTLAGRYLKSGKNPEDQEFKDLFLNGMVRYSNLYPYDGESVYYPAPDYLNRLKKTKEYVFTLKPAPVAPGNQPKKLKGKFVAISDDKTIRVAEVEKDVAYHHSHRNVHDTENGEEGILYSLEVIRENQMFAGSITAPIEKKETICGLLQNGDLYFGKSKAAQYGKCRLVPIEIGKGEEGEKDLTGDVLVTFLSDTILYDNAGNPTVFKDDVIGIVGEELRIKGASESEEYMSGITTGLVTGYLGVWNLRKPAVPVIKAGSFLVFKTGEHLAKGIHGIGGRQLEGYGQVCVDEAKGYTYNAPKLQASRMAACKENAAIKEETKRLVLPIIYDRWLERKINEAIGDKKLQVSNTAAGRMTLMLKESLAEKSGNSEDAFAEFEKRVGSIKSDGTKEEGKRLLKKANEFMNSADDQELQDALRACGVVNSAEKEREKKQRWGRYLMAILTDRKYQGRD